MAWCRGDLAGPLLWSGLPFWFVTVYLLVTIKFNIPVWQLAETQKRSKPQFVIICWCALGNLSANHLRFSVPETRSSLHTHCVSCSRLRFEFSVNTTVALNHPTMFHPIPSEQGHWCDCWSDQRPTNRQDSCPQMSERNDGVLMRHKAGK